MQTARAIALLADVRVGDLERQLDAPSAVLLGAWLDGELVGIATGVVAVDDADVHLVAVEPSRRRLGIGRALTAALCTTFAAHGAQRVLLEVRAGNRAALALYASLGFDEVARRSSYYDDGEDAVVLALVPALPSSP